MIGMNHNEKPTKNFIKISEYELLQNRVIDRIEFLSVFIPSFSLSLTKYRSAIANINLKFKCLFNLLDIKFNYFHYCFYRLDILF